MDDENTIQGQYSEGSGLPQEPKKRSGCWKYGAIGCSVVLLLAVIGGYFAYRGIKGLVSDMTEKYTSMEPMELPAVNASAEEITKVLNRFDIFTNALKKDEVSGPLVLNSRDINILINNHPEWNDISGKASVDIEGDRVKGKISAPLGEMSKMFEGRYLNGSAVFRVGMEAGDLSLFIDSAEVGGAKIPEEIMKVLNSENLAEKANKRPDLVELMKKLESITVKDGSLILSPKSHQQDDINQGDF